MPTNTHRNFVIFFLVAKFNENAQNSCSSTKFQNLRKQIKTLWNPHPNTVCQLLQPSETLLFWTGFFWAKPSTFWINLMQSSPLSSSPEVCNLQQTLSVLDNFLRKITRTENLFADLVWRLWNVLMTKNAWSCSAFQKKLAIILKPLPTISLFPRFSQDERLWGTFRWISSLNKKLLWSATQTILC